MLKILIIATVLLPTLVFAQRAQQLPQPKQPGQWCPAGWMASGSYCVPGSDKRSAAIPKKGWCFSVGAKAVGVGRYYLYPLAAAGQAGVERTLGLMQTELERDMKLMGCTAISQLSRDNLRFR